MLRAEWVFVVSLRGPQNISNFWGEEEVRLLYTKRVLLVATSHFRRSLSLSAFSPSLAFFRIKNSRVSEVRGKTFSLDRRSFSRRWSADFLSGGLAIKARCKLACKRGLRDYTQGRVGRPPRFRLTLFLITSFLINN